MSTLIDCKNIEKTYRHRQLFSGLQFSISENDRIGLIGRNGSGKSTLMKIIAGLIEPDEGEVVCRKYLRINYVAQSDSFHADDSIERALLQSSLLKNQPEDEAVLAVAQITSQIGIVDPSLKIKDLSGGWRKRVAIAEALLIRPDVLLLDEPTNHLDIDNVLWLENFLKKAPCSWMLISHDRQFLQNTVNKIAEISSQYPGGVFVNQGGYQEFREAKNHYIQGLMSQASSLENKMRIEDDWLRRSPKARTTKSQSRIDRAMQLKSDLAEVKSQLQVGQNQFSFSSSQRKTKKLVEIKDCTFSYSEEGKTFGPWNLVVQNGQRLGVLGKNGVGKSTLIKMLALQLEPKKGVRTFADSLRVVYFDQKREDLDGQLTLKEALSEEGDQVVYRDKPLHIVSWAKRFLFEPDQLDVPIGKLSGGEKAKVMLARFMLKPADLLILDEPTNDLDIDSLETLEDSLVQFEGAAIIISHDRFFLEKICNQYIAFDESGKFSSVHSYEQWEKLYIQETKSQLVKEREKEVIPSSPSPSVKKKKLSYMEQREFDSMEERIAVLEDEVGAAEAELEKPDVISDAELLVKHSQILQEKKDALDALYARWAELEAKLN